MELIILGSSKSAVMIAEILKNSGNKIKAAVHDNKMSIDEMVLYSEFMNKENIPIITEESIKDIKCNLCVVINYNKIINVNNIKNTKSINIHMGLLPTYRGNFANAWAILNGENKVGYTIHEVTNELDGGDIYYKYEYLLNEKDTYYEAKNAINDDLTNNLEKVIKGISENSIQGESQEEASYIYCTKLIPQDGYIIDWNLSSDDIIRKYIVFSRPLGTGLKFYYKNEIYEIKSISKIPKYLSCNGFAGAVVNKTDNGGIWVKTKDTAISIDTIINQDGIIIKPSDIFKIGMRLLK